MSPLIVILLINMSFAMFVDKTEDLIQSGIHHETNGISVTDVDNDGEFELVIAVYNGPNLVLKRFNDTYRNIAEIDTPYESLRDVTGAARGVCACDLDGDGREEIYIVNSNHRYSGPDSYVHRLFIWRNGRYEDLYQDDINKNVLSKHPGSSAACFDKDGDGRYGFLVTTYSEYGRGRFRLIEMDESHPEEDIKEGRIKLVDVASQTGIDFLNGGQGIAVGPIVGIDSQLDIVLTNEASSRLGNDGKNNIFQWLSNGTFADIATEEFGDRNQDGRGISIGDINKDGLMDIVYGNWFGPHRIFLQHRDTSHVRFENVASKDFERSSPVTSVLIEDWNNDVNLEILLTNKYHIPGYIDKYQLLSSNRLFTTLPTDGQINLSSIEIGEATESTASATGASAVDLDGDGLLELVICHNGPPLNQSVKIYHVMEGQKNNWLRILPLTQHGAPARGAVVTLTLSDLSQVTKIVDSGSGFLSQMEPVAHFGLSDKYVKFMQVTWPDGRKIRRSLKETEVNATLILKYNGVMNSKSKNQKIYSSMSLQLNDSSTIQCSRYFTIVIFMSVYILINNM